MVTLQAGCSQRKAEREVEQLRAELAAAEAEIERLRGELRGALEQVRNGINGFNKMMQERDTLRAENAVLHERIARAQRGWMIGEPQVCSVSTNPNHEAVVYDSEGTALSARDWFVGLRKHKDKPIVSVRILCDEVRENRHESKEREDEQVETKDTFGQEHS